MLVAAAIVASTFLVASAPAAAAKGKDKNCARQVVNDWYGDGRVDKIFPLHCYTDAVKSLQVDVRDYSNADEDILRALAYAKKGLADPGDKGGSPPPTATTSTGPGPETGTDTTDETIAGPNDGVDTSGPSSVPIPLLILGGLALLLLAAGAAGYLSRRAEAKRAGGDDPPGAI